MEYVRVVRVASILGLKARHVEQAAGNGLPKIYRAKPPSPSFDRREIAAYLSAVRDRIDAFLREDQS